MRQSVFVDNIKCAGCSNTIKKRMEEFPELSNIDINIDQGKIDFDVSNGFDIQLVYEKLKKWGYPPRGEGSKLDTAKSYVSCMIGRLDNTATN